MTNTDTTQTTQGYMNADGSTRPFPWWYCLFIIVSSTVCFPFLLSWHVDDLFFRRAHLQRWLVILSIGLLQCGRVLFAWVAFQVVWTWLAVVIALTLTRRIYITACYRWPLIEGDADLMKYFALSKGREHGACRKMP